MKKCCVKFCVKCHLCIFLLTIIVILAFNFERIVRFPFDYKRMKGITAIDNPQNCELGEKLKMVIKKYGKPTSIELLKGEFINKERKMEKINDIKHEEQRRFGKPRHIKDDKTYKVITYDSKYHGKSILFFLNDELEEITLARIPDYRLL